jgi:SAM-dependent methyltransferase
MFFGDPASAFANIGRALRPGGRLALTVWQEVAANGWVTTIGNALGEDLSEEAAGEGTGYAPGPFSLADPAVCTTLLQSAGFADVTVDDLDIPLPFGTVEEGQAFLETWIDDDLAEDGRAQAAAALRALLVANASADGVLLPSATWLVTARRPNARA